MGCADIQKFIDAVMHFSVRIGYTLRVCCPQCPVSSLYLKLNRVNQNSIMSCKEHYSFFKLSTLSFPLL
jgi:hypothetical protein